MKYFPVKSVFAVITLLLSCYFSSAQVNNNNALQRVIIIRHGEKPAEGDNLSCQGFNRALALGNVLYSKFKLPDYIFVPSVKAGKKTGVARMYQTIVPFAVKYNLVIDTKFEVDDVTGLAEAILKKSGTVFVVWEHNNIPDILQNLGVGDKKFKWKGDDFDSILIITFKNGKAVLSFDKENLNPSATCN